MSDLFKDIVEAFEDGKSIADIAKELGTTKVRVQRVLITAGKWTSKRTEQIAAMKAEGMSVKEIAEALGKDEKTIQTYLPYSRGEEMGYGMEETEHSVNSKEYRDRQKTAAENMYVKDRSDMVIKELEFDEETQEELLEEARYNRGMYDPFVSHDAIYKLKFELVPGHDYSDRTTILSNSKEQKPLYRNEKDVADFRKYAKAENGIIREVLVPGTMNLHSMHYMIQRLFGWQNCHLHNFSLSREDLKLVTGNTVKGWTDLCGTLFSFPDCDEGVDSCWDDDYTEGKSVKTWLRKKYTSEHRSLALGDNWYYNYLQVKEFWSDCKNGRIKTDADFDGQGEGEMVKESTPLIRIRGYGEEYLDDLMESLCVQDLFIKQGEERESVRTWKGQVVGEILLAEEEMREEDGATLKKIAADFDELMKVRRSYGVVQEYMYTNPEEIKKQTGMEPWMVVRAHQKEITMLEGVFNRAYWTPAIKPYFDTIFYSYDYGDGWTVKITCEEIYDRKTNADFAAEDEYFVVDIMNEKDGLEKYRYFVDGVEVDEEQRAVLATIDVKKKPLCVSMDGLNLVEDVGGLHGFLDFLRGIHGEDSDLYDDPKGSKEWAKSLGWTGKMSKPENVL